MPLCTIHLLSLAPNATIQSFLSALRSLPLTLLTILTVARIHRWIILPSVLSTAPLLARNNPWDILLIVPLPSSTPLPPQLLHQISHKWTIQAGVPSSLLRNYAAKNAALLHPPPSSIPPLTGSLRAPRINEKSSQDLELSPELQDWISDFANTREGKGAVSMLNLLAFEPGKKEEYLKYGVEFARSIGIRRGGVAKLVGSVVPTGNQQLGPGEGNRRGRMAGNLDWDASADGWDEIALAHYPSITHFADMIASEDYQAVNQRYRMGSLKDTCILCTTELELDGGGVFKGKL